MRNNGAIIAIVVFLGVLLAVLMGLLIYSYSTDSFLIGKTSSENIASIKNSAEDISFETREKEFIDEGIASFESCASGLKFSLQSQEIESAKIYLNECRAIQIKQRAGLQKLQTYAITYSDKREIEVLKKDFDITEGFFDFVSKVILINENSAKMSRDEARRSALEINEELQLMIFNIETTMNSYQDTYYYQEYLDTPEYREQLAFAKGQADIFQRLVDQLK